MNESRLFVLLCVPHCLGQKGARMPMVKAIAAMTMMSFLANDMEIVNRLVLCRCKTDGEIDVSAMRIRCEADCVFERIVVARR